MRESEKKFKCQANQDGGFFPWCLQASPARFEDSHTSDAALVKHFCVIIPGINMAVGLLLFTPMWSQAAPIDMQNFLFDSRSAPASPFQGKKTERNTQKCSQLQGINPNIFIYLDRKTPAFPPCVLPTESSPPRHFHSLWWRGGATERRLQRIHWPSAFCLPRTNFYFPTHV